MREFKWALCIFASFIGGMYIGCITEPTVSERRERFERQREYELAGIPEGVDSPCRIAGTSIHTENGSYFFHRVLTTDTVGAMLEAVKEIEGPNIEDWLDAIEYVESRGDAEAVGDYKVVDYAELQGGSYPLAEYGKGMAEVYCEYYRIDGREHARYYQAQSIGPYQITKQYVDDVNRIIEVLSMDIPFFTYVDRRDRSASREMVKILTGFYSVGTEPGDHFEVCSRIHNSGPDGWRNDPRWFVRNRGYTLEEAVTKINNSLAYWELVQNAMEYNEKEDK